MCKLLVLGAGQYGMVAKEIAESMGIYDDIEFLDDNNPIAVGHLADFKNYTSKYEHAVVAIGNSELRLKLIEELEAAGYTVPVLIHPTAYVSPSASVLEGSFIEPKAVIHTDVRIGEGCIISAGTIINHNATVGNGCHLNCGTLVKARAVIKGMFKSEYGDILDSNTAETITLRYHTIHFSGLRSNS